MPLGAASCERAERPALSAGADTAARPGHPPAGSWGTRRREQGRGRFSRRSAGAAQPSPPGLPQGADEAVDRALRVQGHDVPYVEEAGHFIRHAASCSKADVPPLSCALAALSGEPPRRGRHGAHGCSADSGGEGHGPSDRVSWLSRAPAPGEPARSAAAAADTPRRAQPRRRENCSRRFPGRFPVPFRSFLSNTFAPPPASSAPHSVSPPRSAPPPRPFPPPGGCWWLQSPSVPSGEFLDQVAMPIGLRGGEEPGERGWEANQRAAAGGGAGPGRGDCA